MFLSNRCSRSSSRIFGATSRAPHSRTDCSSSRCSSVRSKSSIGTFYCKGRSAEMTEDDGGDGGTEGTTRDGGDRGHGTRSTRRHEDTEALFVWSGGALRRPAGRAQPGPVGRHRNADQSGTCSRAVLICVSVSVTRLRRGRREPAHAGIGRQAARFRDRQAGHRPALLADTGTQIKAALTREQFDLRFGIYYAAGAAAGASLRTLESAVRRRASATCGPGTARPC